MRRFTTGIGRREWLPHQQSAVASIQIPLLRRNRSTSSRTLHQQLQRYADKVQTSVPLSSLLEFGSNPTETKLIEASNFLRRELPIRLAKRVIELETLPYGMSRMPSVQTVKKWYMKSFQELVSMPWPKTRADEQQFTELIQQIYERHSGTLWTMARGVYELKSTLVSSDTYMLDYASGSQFGGYAPHAENMVHTQTGNRFLLEQTFPEVREFLDDFFMSRIGIRVLIGQHLALQEDIEGWVGLICERTSPAAIAHNAIQNATEVCIVNYGRAPNVRVSGHLDHTFPYVPSHLHHMLFELLKNSMRAVVEHHADSTHLPDIRIIIADGEKNDDVCIKIMDEGGGIIRGETENIWSYMYTTADVDADTLFSNLNPELCRDFSEDLPMAGLGYGLPISRQFARYFGGEIQVISMEGYGTDAYIHMCCLGQSEEPLP